MQEREKRDDQWRSDAQLGRRWGQREPVARPNREHTTSTDHKAAQQAKGSSRVKRAGGCSNAGS